MRPSCARHSAAEYLVIRHMLACLSDRTQGRAHRNSVDACLSPRRLAEERRAYAYSSRGGQGRKSMLRHRPGPPAAEEYSLKASNTFRPPYFRVVVGWVWWFPCSVGVLRLVLVGVRAASRKPLGFGMCFVTVPKHEFRSARLVCVSGGSGSCEWGFANGGGGGEEKCPWDAKFRFSHEELVWQSPSEMNFLRDSGVPSRLTSHLVFGSLEYAVKEPAHSRQRN